MNKKIIALGMSLLLITALVTVLAQKSVSPNKGGSGTVEINTPWETPKPEQSSLSWNPDKIQKEYAQKVFKEFKWNDSTRTLSFNIPKMDGVNPLIAIKYGTTETPITLGKDYTFKNLPAEFKVYVPIFSDDTFTSVLDNYIIMSYGYANNHKWADGLSSKDLVVQDQYEKNVSLTEVQRALGISK
ncbi:hypothetical protein [Paenibacillus sp. NPDC057934]|uniref:hypothetical protein n=1 Tax=Paenibacillus sp. NPDC057934 TaxID=3346282 RepID=UPI0036D82340